MNYRRALKTIAVAACVLSLLPCFLSAQTSPTPVPKPLPFVSPIFGDDMVLQRGKATIWGWSDPGDKIRVEIGGKHASATAGPDRRWQAKIKSPAVGGPYSLKISRHQTVELHNVLVGDVWLCGGQSNMGVPLRFARNGEEEVKAANYPEIRFYSVATHAAYHHTDVVEGSWKVVSPETADRVSAVAYYFARKVQKEIHVPIGLVVDAAGGTPAEAWTRAAALRPRKDFDVWLAEVEKLASAGAPEYGTYIMHWYDQYDVGIKGNWAAPDFADSTWEPVDIPGGFAELRCETNVVLRFRPALSSKSVPLMESAPTESSFLITMKRRTTSGASPSRRLADTALLGSEKDSAVVGIVWGSPKKHPQIFTFAIGTHTQNGFAKQPTEIETLPLDCKAEDGRMLPGCRTTPACKTFFVRDDDTAPFNFYWDSSHATI